MLQGVLGGGVVLHACRGCRLTLRRRYDLYATVNHMGSIDGGHYVAYMQARRTRARGPPQPSAAPRLFRQRRSLTPPTDGERVVLRRRQPRVGEERAPRGPVLLHSLLPPHHRGVVIAARACGWAARVCVS